MLAVRLARGEVASRVLAHEVLHLYGAVHVNPEVDALMNPSGGRSRSTRGTRRSSRATRGARFGPGGIEANVLPHADLAALIAAYRAALGANVAMRNAGVAEALEAGGGSARAAAPQARVAMQLDEHLGDVANLVAQLLVRDGRPAAAAQAWENGRRGSTVPRRRAGAARCKTLERSRACWSR